MTIGVANASGPVFQTLTVAAGATEILRLKAEFSNPYNLEFSRLDTGAVLAGYQNEFFVCPQRYDRSFRVESGTTYRSDPICPAFSGTRPAHGTLRVLDDWSFTYTPDPGYVGPDQFDYQCITSAETYGTVRITVLPAPPGETTQPPPPARPALPATGVAVGGELAAGLGLLVAGVVGLWLARRRRPAH